MSKFFHSRSFLFIALTITFASCQQENDTPEPSAEIAPNVKKIKDYFDENIKDCFPAGSAAREEGSIRNAVKDLQWYEAQFNEYSNGTSLYIPLEYEQEIRAPKGDGSISYDNLSYVLVSPGENGIDVELVISYPDENYQLSTDNDAPFSGIVEVTDWYGNLKHQFIHRNDSVFEVEGDLTNAAFLNCVTSLACWGTMVETPYGTTYKFTCVNQTTCTEGSLQTYRSAGDTSKDPYSPGGGTGGTGDRKAPEESIDDNNICEKGFELGENGICAPIEKPCLGDFLTNMTITSSGESGLNGGRFGCTRIGIHPECPPGKKNHRGLDISSSIGKTLFSPYAGTVVDLRDTFEPLQYMENSYGNYVIVQYRFVDGQVFYLRFNHLDRIDVSIGQSFSEGYPLGLTGKTGNAGAPHVKPHVHVHAYNANWSLVNPESYLGTKFEDNGSIKSQPCN